VHLPIMLLAASVGVWLFYVQHQFERTSWDRNDAWKPQPKSPTRLPAKVGTTRRI